MSRDLIVYAVAGGLVVAALRLADYRLLVVEHSMALYGAVIAALFAAIGIWLGRGDRRERVVTREVTVEVAVPVPGPVPSGPGFEPDLARAAALQITARELEVLGLVADGLSNREMADRLCISENTVKTHCSRVFDKLGAGRRTEAVKVARDLRLLP